MNDGYEEILVKRPNTPKDNLLKGLTVGVIVLFAAAGIFSLIRCFLFWPWDSVCSLTT